MTFSGVQRLVDHGGSYSVRKILVFVFLIALFPRVLVSLTAPYLPQTHWDVAHDVLIARSLAHGYGFANEQGHPTAYRYPLLPLILSLFFRLLGERYIPFLLFQSILGALVASMTAWLGYRAGGKALALLSGILVALNPELVSFSRMMLTETIFSFFICFAAVVLLGLFESHSPKTLTSFLSGLILGAATLARPIAIIYALTTAAFLLFVKRFPAAKRLSLATALIIGCLIPVAPWLIRNNFVMGAPVFSTSGGVTFWLFGHNDAALSDSTTVIPDEYNRVIREVDPRDYFTVTGGDPARMIPVYNMEPRFQAYSYEQSVVDRLAGLDEVQADIELNRMALDYIRTHPLKTLVFSAKNLFFTLTYTEMSGRLNIVLTFITPFLLLGAYRLFRMAPSVSVVVFAALLSMYAVVFVFYFDHRFRVPFQPFLMLVGAAGLLTVIREHLSIKEKILFIGWMIVPVIVNYFTLFGNQSG